MATFNINANGKTYSFYVHSKYVDFSGYANKSGVYLFLRDKGPDYEVIYVGQSSDIATRLSNHERLHEANRLCVSHVAVALVPMCELDAVEKDLISRFGPIMNTQWA